MKDSKKIDLKEFTQQTVGKLDLEQPSMSFSARIMQAVNEHKIDPSYFKYKPLIPYWGWGVLSLLIGGAMGYLVLSGISLDFIPNTDYTNKVLNYVPSFSLPKVSIWLVIPVGIFSLMTLVEIPLLKKLIDKKLTQ